MIDRSEVKARARETLRTARVSPYIVTLLVIAIGFALDRATDLARSGSPFYSYDLLRRCYDAAAGGDPAAAERLLLSLPAETAASAFLSILASLAMLVVNGGYYIYCMGVRRGAEMPYSTLADGLGEAGRLIWCCIQMSVRIFLWTLLFWVPGIVAAYRYRFSYYNILTDGSLSAGDAIRLSCRQTSGLKWKLFVLDLSFFGWMLLSRLTLGLLNVWLTPYMTMCDLAYFEEGRRRAREGFYP